MGEPSLSADAWTLVLRHLPAYEVARAARVNQEWRNSCRTALQARVDLAVRPGRGSRVGDATVRSAVSKCPRLTNLDLSGCTNLSQEAMKTVSGGLPRLRQLSLNRCVHLGALDGLRKHQRLELLMLNSMCDRVASSAGLMEMMGGGCDHVSYVSHPEANSRPGRRALSAMPDLSFLGYLPRLKTLSLARNEPLEDLSPLADSLGCLADVSVARCPRVASISPLTRHTSTLIKLDLSVCQGLPAEHLSETLPLFTSLKILDISHHTFSSLPFLPPSLVDLNISNCEVLWYLPPLPSLPLLEHLDASWCPCISRINPPCVEERSSSGFLDTPLVEDPKRPSPSALRTINLEWCSSLSHLLGLEHCPSLTSIDISGCGKVQGLDPLLHCDALDKVEASGCFGLNFNDANILALRSRGVKINA